MSRNKGGWRRGDIILVSFPFTDLRGKKTRPALVISNFGSDYTILGKVADEFMRKVELVLKKALQFKT